MSEQDNAQDATEEYDGEEYDTAAALERYGMAYDRGRREQPILGTLAAFNRIVGRGEFEAREVAELADEGADESWGATTITISGREKPMISAALHIVGFFSEELGDIARGVMLRLLEQNAKDLEALTEEQVAALDEAWRRVEEKRVRSMFGDLGFVLTDSEEPAA